jgi:hypothetical protein
MLKVAKLDSPGGGFDHLVFMNTRWEREVITPTLLKIFCDAETVNFLGLASAVRTLLNGRLDAAEDVDEESTSVLNMLFAVGVSMVGHLDRYQVSQPSSYPWRFALTLLDDRQILADTVHDARAEWAAVLAEEAHHPGRLAKMAPLTLSQPYRELMSASGLSSSVHVS